MSGALPSLEPRLQAVLECIRAETHADIGADHAYLLLHLARSGRIAGGVAVEKNGAPLEKARRNIAWAGLQDLIETRHGDGLAPLAPGEVSSLSLCGMGARTMVGILARGPQVLEQVEDVVLQPNDSAEPLRAWARSHGFWLVSEQLVPGFWLYPVLHLRRSSGLDSAYEGVPLGLGLAFGPLLLRSQDALLRQKLEQECERFAALARLSARAAREAAHVAAALAWLESNRF